LPHDFETRSLRATRASHARTCPHVPGDNAQTKLRENRSVTSKAVTEAHTHSHHGHHLSSRIPLSERES